MVYFTDEELDRIIKEDVPFFDLTTHLAGIGDEQGSISYISRGRGVATSLDVVARIYKKLGAEVDFVGKNGEIVEKGDLLVKAKGSAKILHTGWKCCLNILEYTMGISTTSKKLVDEAKRANSHISVVFTRKSFPGTKHMAVTAAIDGGVIPHRLGVSETILIFDKHLEFLGGLDGLENKINEIRDNSHEKKIVVEAHNLEDALRLAKMGVDCIQLDKIPGEKLSVMVGMLKKDYPGIVLIGTGGITIENAYEYAKTGVDVIATSSVFHGKPFDIMVKMEKL